MASLNKVMIIGNLGQDPDIKSLDNGSMIANISIATTEKWKNKQTGNLDSKTEWHRIVMFNKLAELASKYLKKGDPVYIEGQLQTRKWEAQDGSKRSSTEIVARELKFLSSAKSKNETNENDGHIHDDEGMQQFMSDFGATQVKDIPF